MSFFVREPEAAHRPIHRRDADVHPTRRSHALAQLCQSAVVLLADQARHERQGFSVEYAASPAGVRRRSESAGQTPSAQHLLDKGDADAELAGELTSRGRSFVASWGDLGT
jgi:hypothetical protein